MYIRSLKYIYSSKLFQTEHLDRTVSKWNNLLSSSHALNKMIGSLGKTELTLTRLLKSIYWTSCLSKNALKHEFNDSEFYDQK